MIRRTLLKIKVDNQRCARYNFVVDGMTTYQLPS